MAPWRAHASTSPRLDPRRWPDRLGSSTGNGAPAIYHVLDIRTDIRPTLAEVDLDALRANARVLSERFAPAKLLAVVKADAYGHGAMACARALEPHVWGLAVSLVEEGVELRRGGIAKPIVVLGGFYGRAHGDIVAYGLTPVISEPGDLVRFARAVDDLAAGRVQVHLKVDTGMSRLGLQLADLPPLLERARALPGIQVSGLMTHLAEADSDDETATREQLARFAEARRIAQSAGLGPLVCHVANTAGAARFPEARFELVRPGLALFGGVPAPVVDVPGVVPTLRLLTRVVSLRTIPPGTGVSYNAAFRATRTSRIATIPIGYADGYTRRLSGRGQVLVGGHRCPIAGNVTMDMTMIDVTDVPRVVAPGDEVVLIGAQGDASLSPADPAAPRISVEEVADWAGTISYEVYCSISKRVPRVYVSGPRRAARDAGRDSGPLTDANG